MNFDEIKTWAFQDFHEVLTLAFSDCLANDLPEQASYCADRYVEMFKNSKLPELNELKESYLSSDLSQSQASKTHEEIVRVLVTAFCQATSSVSQFDYIWSFYEDQVSTHLYYSKQLVLNIIEKVMPLTSELAQKRELLAEVVNTPMDEDGGVALDSQEALEVMQEFQELLNQLNALIIEEVTASGISLDIYIFDRIKDEIEYYAGENPELEDNSFVIYAAADILSSLIVKANS